MLRLRVDDFPAPKPEEHWKHGLDGLARFDEVMEKNGVLEYVLGVIPRWTGRASLEWLSRNPRIEVALHGIEHDERFQNEFREHLTQKDVEAALRSVKDAWDPVVGPITSYIPPHNSCDLRTMLALKRTGFTDCYGGPGTPRFLEPGIPGVNMHLSMPPHFYGRSDELIERGAIPILRAAREDDIDHVLCLHMTWEGNIGLNSLDRFLLEVFS